MCCATLKRACPDLDLTSFVFFSTPLLSPLLPGIPDLGGVFTFFVAEPESWLEVFDAFFEDFLVEEADVRAEDGDDVLLCCCLVEGVKWDDVLWLVLVGGAFGWG